MFVFIVSNNGSDTFFEIRFAKKINYGKFIKNYWHTTQSLKLSAVRPEVVEGLERPFCYIVPCLFY